MTKTDNRSEQLKKLQDESNTYSAQISSLVRVTNLGLLGVVWTILTTSDALHIDRAYRLCGSISLATGFGVGLILIVVTLLLDFLQYLFGLWTTYREMKRIQASQEGPEDATSVWTYSCLWYRLTDLTFYGKIILTLLNVFWILILLAGALTA